MATYDNEWIIRYVDEELSPEERQEFEASLRSDPAIAAEVELYRQVKTTLKQRLLTDVTREALQTRLAELKKSHFSGAATPAGAIIMRRWIAGVAAAASVIFATLLLWPSQKGDLIDRLGRTEMIGTTERGGNADSLLQQAAVYFNHQDFARALPLLDRAVKEDSASQLALFYRGVAAWHAGKVPAARRDLQVVYSNGSLLAYEAAFYLALSYAAEKNTPVTREWLQKIPEGTPVTARARELAASLK